MLPRNFSGSTSHFDPNVTEISNTFHLLKQGEEKIQLDERYKNVTLVLGNTGAGKTTFLQWIAGDNDKLIAKEVTEDTGAYIIEDGNRIGNSTIKSMTVFPELVIHTRTGTAYYDCPGFSDTRSTSYDIAITYFNKIVADYAENVKLIFVVSYPSVRKGVNRQDFMKLLRHAIDLVKDIAKYQNSIAIMVTKIDNHAKKVGGTFSLVPDEKVIESIGDFLQEVKLGLVESLGSSSISANEFYFCENAIKFVNTLLIKDGEIYTRIGIFRRPDEPGPLSNITLLQEGKEHIDRILYEYLKFTSKDNSDFGYTISDKSKTDIGELIKEINDNVWSNIGNIVENMLKYYGNSIEAMRIKITSFTTSTKAVGADRLEAQFFLDWFNVGYNITSNLMEEVKNTTTDRLAEIIRNSVTALGINGCEDDMESISNQGKYFAFFQVVSDRVFGTRTWVTLLQPLETYLSNSMLNIQKDVNDAAEKINNQINSNTSSVAEKIEEHYQRKMKSMEIEKLPAQLNKGYGFILNMTEEIGLISTAQEMSRKIRNTILNLDIGVFKIRSNAYSVFNLGKYLEFLQIINNKALDIWSSKWIVPFYETAKYLDESSRWYVFLDELQMKLSEYDVQKDKSKYNVANIEDWGQEDKSQGISVTHNNFKQFLGKLKQFNIKGYNEIENIEATDLRVEELRQVLSLTLEKRIIPLCPSDKLVIKGDYIKLSDVNVESRKCNKTIKEIEIFALNKIFINEDLNKVGDKLKLVMIAPRWEVIGNKTINLSGSNGQSQPMANNGTHPGNHGDHGKPGLPGGPAGSFFGIGAEFFNGNMLSIIANGGNSGPGQNGGNGARGRDGDSPIKDPEYYNKYWCSNACSDGQISAFKCTSEFVYKGTSCLYAFIIFPPGMLFCIMYSNIVNIDGKKGTNGGNGGNGGRIGHGSKSGDVKLITLGDDSEISTFNNDGKPGLAGKGGVGGAGGKNGDLVSAKCFYNMLFPSMQSPFNISIIDHGYASIGNNGVNGANSKNIKSPDPAAVISNKAEIINDFKSYLRENLSATGSLFRKNSLIILSNQLDSNTDVKDAYDTLALFEELKSLENQFHRFNKEDLVHFYQSLLDRINEYAQNPKNNEKSNKDKKTLGYLYTAALSKLYDLKYDSDSTLIINVGGYLNLVNKNINALTNLQEKSSKVTIINNYKEAYKTNIDKKLEESNSIIEEQITPTIEEMNTQIDNIIDLLINETIELQKDAEKNLEELFEKKEKLESELVWKRLCGAVKMFAQLTSFVGPQAAAAGSLIGGVISIAESLVIDDQMLEKQLLAVPAGITSTLDKVETQIKAIKDEKVASLNKQLEQIYQEIKPHPALQDITERINTIKEEIVDMSNSDVDEIEITDKIKKRNDEIKIKLKAKEIELNTQKSIKDQNTVKAIKAITKAKQVVQFGAVGLDIYYKLKNDQRKIDVTSNAIKQTEKKLQLLEQYEDKIYSTIAPKLKEMRKDLKATEINLGTKSQVALDVTKWQVQSYLKDMKIKMQELTKGFKVEADLTRCIEMLGDAMTTLIKIYDRIQEYQEQQNLANYIAAVSAPHSADKSNIQDNLEILIRFNLILKQYETAVNALKQWVFPFAAHYLEKITLPSHLKLNITNIEDSASKAKELIGHIKLKFDKYKTAIQDHDEHINSAIFDSHHASTNPFFVWKNEEHKDVISKLLHGKAIVVKADVTGSAPDKDAIKFNLIGIHFRTANETIQQELNDKLKGFKVSATHLGNSYYRYDDKLYVMSSESQNIEYSFEKSTDGVPTYRNVVYDKMKDGDLMLSPYAMWKIQLITLKDKITFNELIMYKDEVDLELEGKGRYVNKGAHIPGLNIEDYYRSDDTVLVIDNDIYDKYELLEQEINDSIPHNVSSFRGNVSLEAWHQSKNEHNATENVTHDSQETLQNGTEDLLMATSENPSIANDMHAQYELLEQEIDDTIPHNYSSFRGNISLEAWHQSRNEDNATEDVTHDSPEALQNETEDPSIAIDIYDQNGLLEQEIDNIIHHNFSSFRGNVSLEAWNHSKNEDNATEDVTHNSPEALENGTDDLFMATSEYPSQMTDDTLSITEHDRFRRFVDIPVSSSASKPTSWFCSLLEFGKELFGKSAALYNKPEEPACDNYNNLHPSSITLGNRLVGEPQPAPTLLEMGDQWIKNADINGLLTFGTLLARKWTGYRPKVLKAPPYDPSIAIKLDIRSQEIVNAFMDKVQGQAQNCGIEETTSAIFESYNLYMQAIKTVREKLATGQVDAITTSLFEQVVQQSISKIASTSTPAQANQLLSSVIDYLEQEVFLQRECQEEKLYNSTSKPDINDLKQEICYMQSIDQLAATFSTSRMGNTFNMKNVFVQNSLQDGNQY